MGCFGWCFGFAGGGVVVLEGALRGSGGGHTSGRCRDEGSIASIVRVVGGVAPGRV